jgi:uncharacterized protein
LNEQNSSVVKAGQKNDLKKWTLIGALIALPLIGVAIYAVIHKSSKPSGPAASVVDWVMYRELDLATGRPTERIAALDGKRVRSPGFMVPLEDNRAEVTEYLLVPNAQACIHAPPPPANQMIYVRMVGSPAKMIYGPVWVEGTLRVSSQTHQYGNAGFQIYGDITEKYTAD